MRLAELTTLRVGGEARELIDAETTDALTTAVLDAWASGERLLVLGGGSNLVISDAGFDGRVVRVLTRGIERDGTTLRVQAGEPWDDVVAFAVAGGLGGIEALSGIPGSTGAAPVQNIGAYGQELSDTLVAIDFLDYDEGSVIRIPAAELELGYRTSSLKQGRRGVVTAIELQLTDGADGSPVGYAQLAAALGVEVGDRMPLAPVRDAVLTLRSSKGMVLSPDDPDSVSAGSFFTNPIVTENFARGLPGEPPRWLIDPLPEARVLPLPDAVPGDAAIVAPPPIVAEHEPLAKLSAAWLIEQSGVARGFSLPGSHAAVSSKHTLAIVNTGGATAEQIVELARYIQVRVVNEFGVHLQPEPTLVGLEL